MCVTELPTAVGHGEELCCEDQAMRRQRWQRAPAFVIVMWRLFSSDSVFVLKSILSDSNITYSSPTQWT